MGPLTAAQRRAREAAQGGFDGVDEGPVKPGCVLALRHRPRRVFGVAESQTQSFPARPPWAGGNGHHSAVRGGLLFRRAPSRSAHTPGTDRVQPPAVGVNPQPSGRKAFRAGAPRLAWGVPAPRHGDLPHQPEKLRSDPATRRRPPRRTSRPGSSAPHSRNHTRPTRSAVPSGRRPTGESLPRLSRRTKRIANVRPYRQVAPQ